MSKYRVNPRTDSNQAETVKQLRSIPGVSVQTGHDDLVVGHRGLTFWYELKTPEAVSKRTGKVLESQKKDSQKELEKNWHGHYLIVSSFEEIWADVQKHIAGILA